MFLKETVRPLTLPPLCTLECDEISGVEVPHSVDHDVTPWYSPQNTVVSRSQTTTSKSGNQINL